MKATTTQGQEIDFAASHFDALKLRLKGSLHFPGEPAYAEARSVWNAMIDRRPLAVVRCLGVADVVAASSSRASMISSSASRGAVTTSPAWRSPTAR